MKKFNLFKMLAVLIVLITSINTAWAGNSTAGTVVYFDKQNLPTLFTSGPYLRRGNTGYSEAPTMSLVAGTKYLYSYSMGAFGYEAISIANGYGWVGKDDGKYSIYQPHAGQSGNSGYSGGAVITQQTEYYKDDISGNFYIKITREASGYDYGCRYYEYEHGDLPTYSISYDAPSNGTLTVEKYTGSTYTALASGTTGLKPTQIIKITTSPDSHSTLASLTVEGATQIDGGDTYYITDDCTISATFEPRWNILGGDTDKGSNGFDAMGDWTDYKPLTYTGTADTYQGTITLAEHETYWLKVYNRYTDDYYGYGTNVTKEDQIVIVGQGGSYNIYSGNQHNLVLLSAYSSGTYTFTWNSSTGVLTVTYPTVTHPSTDYVYCKKHSDWTTVNAHLWGGSYSTVWEHGPSLSTFNYDGTDYYYTALGDADKVIFGQGPVDGHKTKSLGEGDYASDAPTSHRGQFYNASISYDDWAWQNFTATLTFDHEIASNTPVPDNVTVTYGANTNLEGTVITTLPSNSNYPTFGGYYTEEGGEGLQLITAAGAVNANVDGYTSSGNWIRTGESVSCTVYAKFSQNVTLNANHDGYTSNGSATATYNGGVSSIEAPELAGAEVVGYYADAACADKDLVMDPDGTLHNYTGYVTGGKWTRNAATTLYAKWRSAHFIIYRSGDKAGDNRSLTDQYDGSYAGGTISSQIEYRMKVDQIDSWYSLSLPFAVNAVKVWDPSAKTYYDLTPYYRVGENYYLGHYILRTPYQAIGMDINNFSYWEDPDSYYSLPSKNTPYIIMWHNSYFQNKYVSFFGDGGDVIPTSMTVGDAPEDDGVLNVYANNAMTSGDVEDGYTYVSDYGSGAWLRNETTGTDRVVPAFECYIRANAETTGKTLVIKRRTDDVTTGWDDVLNSEYKEVITVYTISGLRVAQYTDCSIAEAGRRMNAELSEGIYILSAGNESVKIMIGGK